jgi:hypothetical protein
LVDAIATDRLYWSRLETLVRRFIVDMPGDADHQKQHIDAWFSDTLYRTARQAFSETAGQFDNTARALRAVVAGERTLLIRLAMAAKESNVQRPSTQGVTA